SPGPRAGDPHRLGRNARRPGAGPPRSPQPPGGLSPADGSDPAANPSLPGGPDRLPLTEHEGYSAPRDRPPRPPGGFPRRGGGSRSRGPAGSVDRVGHRHALSGFSPTATIPSMPFRNRLGILGWAARSPIESIGASKLVNWRRRGPDRSVRGSLPWGV